MSCPPRQSLFRVFLAGASGWELTCAPDEERARFKFRKRKDKPTLATPVRPSSYWQRQRELGLYPIRGTKRRRIGGK
jgi:hypothetical protein